MIVKKVPREERLGDHVLTKELKFLLKALKKFSLQIDTILFCKLEREPGKVFVGLHSTKFQEGFGSEIVTEKDLSYLKRRFENKKTFIEK